MVNEAIRDELNGLTVKFGDELKHSLLLLRSFVEMGSNLGYKQEYIRYHGPSKKSHGDIFACWNYLHEMKKEQ